MGVELFIEGGRSDFLIMGWAYFDTSLSGKVRMGWKWEK